MKQVYGYIRVSTAKQGEGVSLIEQKEAIIRYASQQHLEIIKWIEEKETAAKSGRPLFNTMMNELKSGKASGVIIHKIDRSARNLRDWADLGDLIDKGIDVHFAHESLDLKARGGRLSADIQAVIASDYIRNLREEAMKGIYGRLKQGVYPFRAPIGYLDKGAGNFKEIDPIKGPLVKKAFELYASRKYSLESLVPVLNALGLQNTGGMKINDSSLSAIFNNPFYMGIIKVKDKIFKGGHMPLIKPQLYRQVQKILKDKSNTRLKKHHFMFRRIILCKNCGYSLVGEIQKGHIYYRCHTKNCPTKGLRETMIEKLFKNALQAIQFYPDEIVKMEELLKQTEADWGKNKHEFMQSVILQQGQIENKLYRLTDAYIDSLIDKDTYNKRKEKLLTDQRILDERKRALASDETGILMKARKFLELTKDLINCYEKGFLEEKRELIEIVTSNLAIQGKNLMITIKSPFYELSQRYFFLKCPPNQGTSRTYDTKIVYSDNNISPIMGKPLSEAELKLLLDEILKHVDTVTELNDEFKL